MSLVGVLDLILGWFDLFVAHVLCCLVVGFRITVVGCLLLFCRFVG